MDMLRLVILSSFKIVYCFHGRGLLTMRERERERDGTIELVLMPDAFEGGAGAPQGASSGAALPASLGRVRTHEIVPLNRL
jgi:hypothetical protein